ncbi:TPA: hypothetical protein N0F65_002959 [Lagenidium giganteum]|uniref:Uncharacterized protein n=1 Tax=Lagenidium giganteum TaxID=4803 RepID=A0AAV2Z3A4_9STRA|nr:TPA: hypothetical protein N0F65_002959 [Lagenidium giganteum]
MPKLMERLPPNVFVIEEEIDPSYEPTEKEVVAYAAWLGMDVEADNDLLWIARAGLREPMPENWKICKKIDTNETFYYHIVTGDSTTDNPCDEVASSSHLSAMSLEIYRNLLKEHKRKRLETADAGAGAFIVSCLYEQT